MASTLFAGNTLRDTDAIAYTTMAMILGVVPFSAQYLLQRAFYAYEDARTPFLIQIPVVATAALISVISLETLSPRWIVVGVGVGLSAGFTVGGAAVLPGPAPPDPRRRGTQHPAHVHPPGPGRCHRRRSGPGDFPRAAPSPGRGQSGRAGLPGGRWSGDARDVRPRLSPDAGHRARRPDRPLAAPVRAVGLKSASGPADSAVMVRDRGDILLGWLTRVVVALAVVGVIGIDGVTVATATVSLQDQANTAATAARDDYASHHDTQRAYRAALASAHEGDEADVIRGADFRVTAQGTVTLVISRPIHTRRGPLPADRQAEDRHRRRHRRAGHVMSRLARPRGSGPSWPSRPPSWPGRPPTPAPIWSTPGLRLIGSGASWPVSRCSSRSPSSATTASRTSSSSRSASS